MPSWSGSVSEAALRPATLGQRIVFHLTRGFVVLVAKLWFRVTVVGREKLPAQGAFVLAPVHRSNLDSPLMGVLTRRRMRFMGKDSLWRVAPAVGFLYAIGGYPVSRGTADRDALRTSTALIERGEPVVMFPEGTRCDGPVLHPMFDGPAYVASRTAVPIVPVGIGGSERAMGKGARFVRPVKIAIVVGDPIPPASPSGSSGRVSRRAVRETTERLREELQVLFDRAQALAGRPNPPHD